MSAQLWRQHSQRRAFTLVELLVVIGIIALLIGVLLPALNKARQAANVVDCQARMGQMGQALQIYVSQSKGLLPFGLVMRDPAQAPWIDPGSAYTATPSNKEPFWWWFMALSDIMNRSTLDSNPNSANYGRVTNLSPIFRDKDTIESRPGVLWVNHYTANPRVFYRADVGDPTAGISGSGMKSRKVTNVKYASNIWAIWDAPQPADQGFNSYPVAESIDVWGWYNTGLLNDRPGVNLRASAAIEPGAQGPISGLSLTGKANQIKFNFDPQTAFGSDGWASHLRFRHMNNTRMNALCLDGHVESRAVGTVLRKDIYTNSR